jgi:hypothetical protein
MLVASRQARKTTADDLSFDASLPRCRNESKKFSLCTAGASCQNLQLAQMESQWKLAPMTVSSPNTTEIKLDRLIDDMRLLRSQIIAFDMHLKGIEAYLKAAERSERRRESKSRPRFAAAASATARTVLVAVGAAIGATVLLYLATWADNGIASPLMLLRFGGVGAA